MFDTLNRQTNIAISTAEELVKQLKQQLKQAQDTLNSLYQQQQLEQTAQGTVQTALDMAGKAYHALATAYPNNPEAIQEFEQAFLALRNRQPQTEPALEPATEPEDNFMNVTPQPTPSNGNGHHSKQSADHTNNGNGSLKMVYSVDAEVATSPAEDITTSSVITAETEETTDNKPNLSDLKIEEIDVNNFTLEELKKLPREVLLELCERDKVAKNGNRLHLAQRLIAKTKTNPKT